MFYTHKSVNLQNLSKRFGEMSDNCFYFYKRHCTLQGFDLYDTQTLVIIYVYYKLSQNDYFIN